MSHAICAVALLTAAAPPGLRELVPPAVQRGVESELRIYGLYLESDPELYLPFRAEVTARGVGPEVVTFKIKPAAETPPGVYPVRVRTRHGVSNLRLLNLTDVPVVRVQQPEGAYRQGRLDPARAQAIPVPCVLVGGRLLRETNAFRFKAKVGERLTFVTETWRLGLTPDPLLQLRDPRGRLLEAAHDTPGLQRDERIDYTFRTEDEHYLETLSTGGGGWNNHYLIKVGAFNYARAVFPLGGKRGETVRFSVLDRDLKASVIETRIPADPWSDHWRLPLPEHGGSLPWPLASGALNEVVEAAGKDVQTLTWPVVVNGRIARPDEQDTYRLVVEPGQHIRLRVEAFQLGSRLDGYLMVYDPVGMKLLAKHDDQVYRGDPDPALTFEVPAGVREVRVALTDTRGEGGLDYGYRLTVERGGPDFFLWMGNKQQPTNQEDVGWHRVDKSDTLALPVGREAKFRVSLRRAKEDDPHYAGPVLGYTGPVALTAENLPRGVACKPAVIPPGKTEGELILVADDTAPRQPFEFAVVGTGQRPDGSTIRRFAERRLHISDPQIPNLPWNWRVTKVVGVATRPEEKTR